MKRQYYWFCDELYDEDVRDEYYEKNHVPIVSILVDDMHCYYIDNNDTKCPLIEESDMYGSWDTKAETITYIENALREQHGECEFEVIA